MRSSTQRATESDVSAHYQEALQRATQAHGEGRLDEAAALYRSLLDEPGAQRHILHYVLGMAASEQGDPITALAHYDSAQAAGYASADLFSRRAGILHAMGRWDDALDAYDRAVAAGVQTPNLFNNRGVVRETLGAFDDALEDYDAALALNTEYLQARHNKGSTLLKLKRFEDAIEPCAGSVGSRRRLRAPAWLSVSIPP
jgi:tetratricopeptide (TPR) repeat protein